MIPREPRSRGAHARSFQRIPARLTDGSSAAISAWHIGRIFPTGTEARPNYGRVSSGAGRETTDGSRSQRRWLPHIPLDIRFSMDNQAVGFYHIDNVPQQHLLLHTGCRYVWKKKLK